MDAATEQRHDGALDSIESDEAERARELARVEKLQHEARASMDVAKWILSKSHALARAGVGDIYYTRIHGRSGGALAGSIDHGSMRIHVYGNDAEKIESAVRIIEEVGGDWTLQPQVHEQEQYRFVTREVGRGEVALQIPVEAINRCGAKLAPFISNEGDKQHG